MSVGFPAHLHLNLFGQLVRDYFGATPYQVGSSTESKDWRDVDIVVILSDKRFAKMFPDAPTRGSSADPKWAACCMAWAALGAQMTGLPIDFKVQQRTQANETFKARPRQALILPLRPWT